MSRHAPPAMAALTQTADRIVEVLDANDKEMTAAAARAFDADAPRIVRRRRSFAPAHYITLNMADALYLRSGFFASARGTPRSAAPRIEAPTAHPTRQSNQ